MQTVEFVHKHSAHSAEGCLVARAQTQSYTNARARATPPLGRPLHATLGRPLHATKGMTELPQSLPGTSNPQRFVLGAMVRLTGVARRTRPG